jgi:hypothetical protein
MGLDFAEDVDPTEFITGDKVAFLHKIGRYAGLVDRRVTDERKLLALSRRAGTEVGNYLLVLENFEDRMPDIDADDMLDDLVADMRHAHSNRETLGRQMVPLLEKIYDQYAALSDYLEVKRL